MPTAVGERTHFESARLVGADFKDNIHINVRERKDALHVIEVTDPHGKEIELRIFAHDLADPAAVVKRLCMRHGFSGVESCARDIMHHLLPELDRLYIVEIEIEIEVYIVEIHLFAHEIEHILNRLARLI